MNIKNGERLQATVVIVAMVTRTWIISVILHFGVISMRRFTQLNHKEFNELNRISVKYQH